MGRSNGRRRTGENIMTTNSTKSVNIMDLKTGMIVHCHSARFEITSTRIYQDCGKQGEKNKVMVANGKWLDGRIEPFYFGPEKDWKFQGNYLYGTLRVE